MAFTYDTTTSRGLVRLIISDTTEANATFDDAEIDAFLGLEGDLVDLAAARALETIATNEALVQKRIRLLDLTTDGPAVARALREHAAQLRASHEADDDFAVATMVVDQFTARDRLWAEQLRALG